MDTYKTCCCIGHRKIRITDELKREVHDYVESLIVNENVQAFLFGSNSEFDYFCNDIIKELKEKYPFIKRVGYTCLNEAVMLESDRVKWEKVLSDAYKHEVHLFCVDEEHSYRTRYVSGKAAYVERNQAMIDDSEYCLFYYNENYAPPKRKTHKNSVIYYQPKSGTAIAIKYAKRKNKIIKNFYKE